MPKKMGTNTKAVEARARKEEKKNLEKEQKQKAIEDEYWKDTDKHVMKKEQRKADQEKKKQETLEKKAFKQQLYEEEMSSIKSASSSVSKMTRAQISKTLETKPKPSSSLSDNKPKEIPLEENINRIQVEGLEARTVDEAISALSMKDADLDRHPERRLKAAYTAFEERMLPRYKIEYPTLRMSQVKHLLRKEWQKSSENPLNQPHSSFNSKS